MGRDLMKSQGDYVGDIYHASKVSVDAAALELIKFVYDQKLAGAGNLAECFNHCVTAINYMNGVPSYPRSNSRISQNHLGNPIRDAIEKVREALELPPPEGASTYKPTTNNGGQKFTSAIIKNFSAEKKGVSRTPKYLVPSGPK